MPIYAFECAVCGHRFDRLQRLADPDPSDCPECGATQVRRQLTAPSFRLAGGGWYETDFKKDSDKKRNLADRAEPVAAAETKSEAKSEANPESKSEAKSETKPEAKTQAKTEAKPQTKIETKPASKPPAADTPP